MKPVQVIGGGFSGLATAFYLAQRSVPVEIFERSQRLGGLIATRETPHGLVETAARGLLASPRVEALFRELRVPLERPRPESKARYVFRGRPRRWPLGLGESLSLLGKVSAVVVFNRARFGPQPGETVATWGRRVLGAAATDFILAPALQGIYAGRVEELSASWILGRAHRGRNGGRSRGLVAPPKGMGQLIDALELYLKNHGVRFHLGNAAAPPDGGAWRVLATSARDASRLLRDDAPEVSQKLSRVDILPLVTVTSFYPARENRWPGFGILFPRKERFRALGVLFDSNVFEGRGSGHAESWILGGAKDRSVIDLTDEKLFDVIDADRDRVYGRHTSPLARYVTRWPEAIPHYTLELEALLGGPLQLPPRTFLVGNYLGGIGLARILERAHDVAQQVAEQYRRAA